MSYRIDASRLDGGESGDDDYQAWRRPSLILPLSSILPLSQQNPPPLPARIFAVSRLAGRVCGLAELLRTDLPMPEKVSKELADIGFEASNLTRIDAPGRDRMVVATDRSEVDGSVEYDGYFGFVRATEISSTVMAAQIVATCGAVLTEMSCAVLAVDEIIAALDAMGGMFRWCTAASRALSVGPPATPGSAAPQATAEMRAEYRWVIGHHLFNLSTLFCLADIRSAQTLAVTGDAEGTAAALHSAARYLRATTAAMWFAGNFPNTMYLRYVRPSMALHSGNESGFSGTQNLDYHRLRRAIDALHSILDTVPVARHGAVGFARAVFLETEIQDVEHHILIAAAKVGGTEPSLLTLSIHDALPDYVPMVPAVEVLRDLAVRRRSYRESRL